MNWRGRVPPLASGGHTCGEFGEAVLGGWRLRLLCVCSGAGRRARGALRGCPRHLDPALAFVLGTSRPPVSPLGSTSCSAAPQVPGAFGISVLCLLFIKGMKLVSGILMAPAVVESIANPSAPPGHPPLCHRPGRGPQRGHRGPCQGAAAAPVPAMGPCPRCPRGRLPFNQPSDCPNRH